MKWSTKAMMLGAAVASFLTAGTQLAGATCLHATIASANPHLGPVGSPLSVTGDKLAKGMRVKVMWNGIPGSVLGEGVAASDGHFSVPVTVPDSAPGINYIVAVVGKEELARFSYEVTGEAAIRPAGVTGAALGSPALASDGWRGFAPTRNSTVPVTLKSSQRGMPVALLAAGFALVGAGFMAAGTAIGLMRTRRRLLQP